MKDSCMVADPERGTMAEKDGLLGMKCQPLHNLPEGLCARAAECLLPLQVCPWSREEGRSLPLY
jgi:hypothetical protein